MNKFHWKSPRPDVCVFSVLKTSDDADNDQNSETCFISISQNDDKSRNLEIPYVDNLLSHIQK